MPTCEAPAPLQGALSIPTRNKTEYPWYQDPSSPTIVERNLLQESFLSFRVMLGSELPAGGGNVLSLALSDDGRLMFVGLSNGLVNVLDLENGEIIGTLEGHGASTLEGISISSDGSMLATASGDGTIVIWELDQE